MGIPTVLTGAAIGAGGVVATGVVTGLGVVPVEPVAVVGGVDEVAPEPLGGGGSKPTACRTALNSVPKFSTGVSSPSCGDSKLEPLLPSSLNSASWVSSEDACASAAACAAASEEVLPLAPLALCFFHRKTPTRQLRR